MLQGWVLDDETNVIRMTKRGREREDRGRTPTYRRRPWSDERAIARAVAEWGAVDAALPRAGPRGGNLRFVERLPALIICPGHAGGGLKQIVDAEMLRCPVYRPDAVLPFEVRKAND